MLLAQFLILRNIQPIKQRCIRSDFEKALQHTHVEGLSESARACEKIHFTPI